MVDFHKNAFDVIHSSQFIGSPPFDITLISSPEDNLRIPSLAVVMFVWRPEMT